AVLRNSRIPRATTQGRFLTFTSCDSGRTTDEEEKSCQPRKAHARVPGGEESKKLVIQMNAEGGPVDHGISPPGAKKALSRFESMRRRTFTLTFNYFAKRPNCLASQW